MNTNNYNNFHHDQRQKQKSLSRVPKYSDKFKDLLTKTQQFTMNKQKKQPQQSFTTNHHHSIQPKETEYLGKYLIKDKEDLNEYFSSKDDKQVNLRQKKEESIHNQIEGEYQFLTNHNNNNEQDFFFYRVKSIGVGAHSFVYLIQQQSTKFLYAQKAIVKTHAQKHLTELINQIKIQFILNHDNLISLYHFYSDSSYIYLVMEYAQQSLFSLKQKFGIFKEKQVIQILRQMLHGIQYMHKKGYIHADIKIQNVMIRNGRIKLCDFGYAINFKEIKKIDPNQIIGTLDYLSPEYANGYDTGPLRDIWAIGILCFELWTGKNPFQKLKQNQKWLKLAKVICLNYKIQPEYSQFLKQIQRIQRQQERKSQKITKIIQHTLCPYQERYSAQKLLKFQFFNIVN